MFAALDRASGAKVAAASIVPTNPNLPPAIMAKAFTLTAEARAGTSD